VDRSKSNIWSTHCATRK